MKHKKLNKYEKNEDGTISIEIGEYKATVDAADALRLKLHTWTRKKCGKGFYPVANKNTKLESGKYKNESIILGRFILGNPNQTVKYIDGNPFNCTKKNLRLVFK